MNWKECHPRQISRLVDEPLFADIRFTGVLPLNPPASRELVPAAPAMRGSSFLALAITAVLLFIVPTMVGVIYWRWATIHGPSTAILMVGDGSLDGAKVVVTNNDRHRWAVELDRDNDWQSPIFLDPGPYRVTVTHRDHEILSEPFTLDRMKGIRFDLPSLVWIVGGGALSEARVDVVQLNDKSHEGKSSEVALNSRDHYRAAMYLHPGRYMAIARSVPGGDRVLAESEFVVDRNRVAPLTVELLKAVNDDGFNKP